MVAPWARITASTINDQIRKLVEPGLHDHVLLAMMGSKGRITYNHGGKKFDWRVKYRRAEINTHGDMETIAMQRINRWKTAELEWKAYSHGEALSKFERLAQQNTRARLFNLTDETLKAITADFREDFHKKLYKNANTAGNADDVDGLDTIFGTPVIISGSKAAQTGTSDTYAGLNTRLNQYGAGSWTGNWPAGTGSLQYHFFSPMIVDSTHGDWDAEDTTAFKYTWRLAMGYANTYQKALHNSPPDLWLTTPAYERDILDSLESKERIQVNQDQELLKMGFKSVSFEGTPIVSEQACTASKCYGISWKNMELRSMQSQLIAKDDDEDITTQTKRITCDAWVNMRFQSPCFFVRLDEIGTAAS